MQELIPVVIAGVISVLPALLFLGFYSWMKRMQQSAMISVLSTHPNCELKEVTFADAFSSFVPRSPESFDSFEAELRR
jgi:hypothetical protein